MVQSKQTNRKYSVISRFVILFGLGAICVSTPAQDTTLTIVPSVHVTWSSLANTGYQVQSTTNLSGTWTPIGPLVEGNGGITGEFFEATDGARFFRVQQSSASGVNWLQGVWQATTYQASSNSVPFTTVLSINNSTRAFSGVYSNATFTCSATMGLLSYTGDEASFFSTIQSGPCLNGTLVVTRVNATNALYNWYSTQGPAAASSFGVLTKIQ